MRDRTQTFEKRSAGNQVRPAGGTAQSAAHTFLGDVVAVRDMVKSMQQLVGQLGTTHDRMLGAIREAERMTHQRNADALTAEIDGLARAIRLRLQEMEAFIVPGTQQFAMMKNQRADVARKFREVVIAYHDIQMRLQSSEKQQLERQIRIVNPGATEEEVRHMVDEQSGPVFSQTILQSTRRDEAQRILREVEERHAHVLDLSRSILELQQLFDNLSSMIETQDTLVGQISNNVNDVEANTQQANTELRHAITSAKSARRKKWCLICTLFIVLLGLATYLAIHFLVINPPSKENSTAAKSTADTSIARESVLTASSVDNDTDATFYRVG